MGLINVTNVINDRTKKILYINIFMLILSIIYIAFFELYLRDLSANNFILIYPQINALAARPIFYGSLAFLGVTIGGSLLNVTIPTNYKAYSKYSSIVFIVLYLIAIAIQFFVGLPDFIIMILYNNSILFILLGVLISLAISENRRN